MKEQTLMTLSKNSDLQDEWKTCVRITCFAVRTFEGLIPKLTELFNTIKNLVQALARKIAETFSYVSDLVAEAFNRCAEKMDYKIQSEPKKRPTYKRCVKSNSTGFHRPIIYRARSRC